MLFHLIKGKALLRIVEDEPLEKMLDELAARDVSAVDLLGHLTDGDGWMDEA